MLQKKFLMNWFFYAYQLKNCVFKLELLLSAWKIASFCKIKFSFKKCYYKLKKNIVDKKQLVACNEKLLDHSISLLKGQDKGQLGCFLDPQHIYLKRTCLSEEQESISFRETIYDFFYWEKRRVNFFYSFLFKINITRIFCKYTLLAYTVLA